METTFTSTTLYAGEFRHAIDPKGRVTVPSKWRRGGESEDLYVMPHQNNQCLVIMPPEEFHAVGVRTQAMPGISEQDKRVFLRRFYSQAQPSSVDRQGRMLLPEDYCKRVGLGENVLLAGTDSRFEIWNPDRWKEVMDETHSVYRELADRMGI